MNILTYAQPCGATLSKLWKKLASTLPRLSPHAGRLAAVLVAALGGVGSALAANTDGTVSFTVTTTNYSATFSPKNVAAVWVVDGSGKFVKTLCRHAVAQVSRLYSWNTARGSYTNVDGVTSATLSTEPQTHAVTWNCRDTNNVVVADGTYYVQVEYTSADAQGPFAGNYCSFVKGAASVTTNYPNYSNGGGGFYSMALTYTPILPVVDVAVTALAPASGLINATVPVQVTVSNLSASAQSFTVALSNRTSNTQLGSQAVNALAANSGTTVTINWSTTGLTPGAYQLKAQASTVAGETNTANNALTSSVTLTAPVTDIAVTALTPASGLINTTVPIQVTVSNLTAGAQSFTVALSNLTAHTQIGTQAISALPGNSGTTVTLNWNTAGLTTGSYQLSAQASTVAGETNTANNVRASTLILTATVVNDLAVTALAPAAGFIGSNVLMQVAVTNLTTNTASAVLLALNNITGSSTLIATQQFATLAGLAGTNVTLNWNTAGLTAGTYQVQAALAPAAGEVVLGNNYLTNAVALRAPLHDLAAGAFTLPAAVPPAQLINVLVAVTNLGDYAETFNCVLSDLTAAQTIGTRSIASLAAAAATNVSFSWNTTNATLVLHTLRAVAGPVAGELNLVNNTNTCVVLVTLGSETNQLVARGSAWSYLDAGLDLSGAPWIQAGFYDGTWASGFAPLGYSLPNIVTPVGFGGNPSNRYVTTYFRRTFFVDTLPTLVTGNVLRADGVVLYLNGQELTRQNMPAGGVSGGMPALAANTGVGATTYYGFVVPTNLLIVGRNQLAAEVHLASAASTALGFDLELSAVAPVQTHTTNVAVSAVQTAGGVLAGDVAHVSVTLTNSGNVSTGYTVLLKDLTTGAIIGSQTMASLAPGEVATAQLNWSTFGAAAANHTLQALTVVNGTTNAVGVGSAVQPVAAATFRSNPVNAVGSIGGRCNAVAVSGHYAYLGCGATLEIWNVATPANPARVATLRLPGNIEDLALASGRIFASSGASGVHAVDIGNPTRPVYLGSFDSSGFAGPMAVNGNTVYVADGLSGVRMLNASGLSLAGAYQTTGAAEGVAYTGSNLLVMDGSEGLQVLSTNATPTVAGALSGVTATLGFASGSGYALASDADGAIYRINTSLPSAPTVAAKAQLPAAGRALAISGSTAYVAAGAVGLLTVDATSLTVLATNSIAGGDASAVVISGGTLYVAAGFAGCQAFTLSGGAPTALATLRTGIRAMDAVAQGSDLLVAADEGGLQVHSLTNFAQPVLRGATTVAGNARCVALAGPLAVVGDGFAGVKLFSTAGAGAPTLVGSYADANLGLVRRLAVAGTHVAVTDGNQIQLLDISQPAAPVLVATNVPGGFVFDLAATSNAIFAACGGTGLRIFSATTLGQLGSYSTTGPALGISISSNRAQVALGASGWVTLDITSPGTPAPLQAKPGQVFDVATPGILTYLVSGQNAGQVYDVTTPLTPVSTQTFTALARALRVRAMGGLMLTLEDEAGLGIFNVSTNDVNLNGIPDTWDQQVVDASTNDNVRSIWDITANGLGANGYTYYQSYVAGLNPADPSSVFVIQAINPLTNAGGTQFVISWNSVAGRNYTVNKSTDLLAGFSVLQANIVGAAGVTSYTDTLSSAHAFYMVDINP